MALPAYLIKPASAIGGDDQVPVENLKGFDKVVRKDIFDKREHSPYASSSNSWNENTVVTDVAPKTRYWLQFTYQGTSSTRAWEFATQAALDTAATSVDTAAGQAV